MSTAETGFSLRPPVCPVFWYIMPSPRQLLHLGGFLYGSPFFLNFSMCPVPPHTLHLVPFLTLMTLVCILTSLLNAAGLRKGGFLGLPLSSAPMLNVSAHVFLSISSLEKNRRLQKSGLLRLIGPSPITFLAPSSKKRSRSTSRCSYSCSTSSRASVSICTPLRSISTSEKMNSFIIVMVGVKWSTSHNLSI